jgi:hypothetical protein
MQLLKLVVFDIGIKAHAAHGVGIVLVRDWTVLARAGVPRGDYTFPHDASMIRGGTVVMRMIGSETPSTNLPQRAVILVMVGRILIALKAVRERGRRPRPLTFLTGKESKASL